MFETTVFVVILSIINGVTIKKLWSRKIHWAEAALPFAVCLLICFLCKFAAETALTTDYEYHGGWCVRSEYYEAWTEEYEVDVPDYCTRSDGKGGTETYQCGSHKEKRTTYHPAVYQIVDSNGYDVSISYDMFQQLCQRFGNREFKTLFHLNQVSIGDGNMYYTVWRGEEPTFLPVTTQHRYVNKIQAADQSIFHFQPLDKDDKAEYGLFDTPDIHDYVTLQYLQGDTSPEAGKAASKLEIWNAKLGREKQVSMHILVFHNQPLDAALKQEAYWMGGNKNEFIVCVGLDDKNKVQWSHIISWTDQERLKIDVRDFARNMGQWSPLKLIDFMVPAVRKDFVRKPFAEFDYLKVETPTWGKVLALVLSILAIGRIDYMAVRNQFDEDDKLADVISTR
jgi:hypothetical protein